MHRTLLALPLGLLLLLPHSAAAQKEDEPVVAGKKSSEWMKILLSDNRPKARLAALAILEVIGPKADRVLPTLTYVMTEDKDAEMRREVAQTLGRMGEDAKGAVKALARVLGDDGDGAVREAAARALGAMAPHSRSAVDALGKALQDKHAGARTGAAAALKELGEEAKPALNDAIDALKALKGNDDSPARVYLAKLIGMLHADAKGAVPPLAETVADRTASMSVREAAAEALGRFGEEAESAVKQLGEAVTAPVAKGDPVAAARARWRGSWLWSNFTATGADPYSGLRKASLLALAKVSSDPKLVWPFVKSALREGDGSVRQQAVRTAGPLGKTEGEIVTALEDLALKDLNVDVRLASIQELGALGAAAKSALKTLTFLARNEPRPALREAAATAVKNLEGN